MDRRVTDRPRDEYRRQLDDLHRRTDWEHGSAARPDPDWETPRDEDRDPAALSAIAKVVKRLLPD